MDSDRLGVGGQSCKEREDICNCQFEPGKEGV